MPLCTRTRPSLWGGRTRCGPRRQVRAPAPIRKSRAVRPRGVPRASTPGCTIAPKARRGSTSRRAPAPCAPPSPGASDSACQEGSSMHSATSARSCGLHGTGIPLRLSPAQRTAASGVCANGAFSQLRAFALRRELTRADGTTPEIQLALPRPHGPADREVSDRLRTARRRARVDAPGRRTARRPAGLRGVPRVTRLPATRSREGRLASE